jgi:hypothetical protein
MHDLLSPESIRAGNADVRDSVPLEDEARRATDRLSGGLSQCWVQKCTVRIGCDPDPSGIRGNGSRLSGLYLLQQAETDHANVPF